jgi:hypothetical protein
MKNNKIKIKKRLNKESFDTLLRLSRIAYESKNSLEGFLIDQIILRKAREINLSLAECYVKYFNHNNCSLKVAKLKKF